MSGLPKRTGCWWRPVDSIFLEMLLPLLVTAAAVPRHTQTTDDWSRGRERGACFEARLDALPAPPVDHATAHKGNELVR
jgi:hypothetical protein